FEHCIFADVRKRDDLAFTWLYQEYVYVNGYEIRVRWKMQICLCLPLYLNLMPSNHYLIQPLATIYIAVNENIKQVVVRVLEISVSFID
ncbi:unnamed protein product, partial [Rotaria sp. Silwood2]